MVTKTRASWNVTGYKDPSIVECDWLQRPLQRGVCLHGHTDLCIFQVGGLDVEHNTVQDQSPGVPNDQCVGFVDL